MSPPGGELHVDRLALRVGGLDEGAARALARLVAEGLTPSLPRATGIAALDALKVEVRADTERDTPELLARRIIDEIGRVLARDRIAGGPDAETVS